MKGNKQEDERGKHFRNALSNYAPVLAIGDGVLGIQLKKADEGLSFPESPTDVLGYLGNIEPLNLTEDEKDAVRFTTLKLIDQHGFRHVWDSRLRYKLEIEYIYHII